MQIQIKHLVRNLVRASLVKDRLWRFVGPTLNQFTYFRIQRQVVRKAEYAARLNHWLGAHPRVLAGPFRGLRYPALQANGSALWPKLIGTYECELHPIVQLWREERYEHVFDWGCAEGFYLAGAAWQLPAAKLWGIEPDESARQRTRSLISHNGISPSRLNLRSSATLADFRECFRQRCLLICDCEGFERTLFSADLDLLRRTDILVECHDFVVPGTTDFLLNSLAHTHRSELVASREREPKDWPEGLENDPDFEVDQQLELMQEGRPTQMNWIWAQSLECASNE